MRWRDADRGSIVKQEQSRSDAQPARVMHRSIIVPPQIRPNAISTRATKDRAIDTMGMLVDGVAGRLVRYEGGDQGSLRHAASQFRNWITPDGGAGPPGKAGFTLRPGAIISTYHRFVLGAPHADFPLKRLQDLYHGFQPLIR